MDAALYIFRVLFSYGCQLSGALDWEFHKVDHNSYPVDTGLFWSAWLMQLAPLINTWTVWQLLPRTFRRTLQLVTKS